MFTEIFSRMSTIGIHPGIFLGRAVWANGWSWDQFKPIRVGENLVVNNTLYKWRNMQISPLNLNLVLLFSRNSKATYWRSNACSSRWASRSHDRDSCKTYDEKERFRKIFKSPFGQILKSAWHFRLPIILPDMWQITKRKIILNLSELKNWLFITEIIYFSWVYSLVQRNNFRSISV